MMTPEDEPDKIPVVPLPFLPEVRTLCLEDLTPTIRSVARLLGGPSDGRIRDLVEKGGPATRIGYDRDALEYNRAFFLRNAVKCLTVSQTLLDDPDRVRGSAVLDVGGGVGTFALSVSERRQWSDRLVIDRSPAQIALGRRIVGAASRDRDMRWAVSDDVPPAWSNEPVALFSYSLCESPRLLSSALERGWRTALVVDYPAVIDHCAAFASLVGARFVRTRASVALCSKLADAVGQTNVTVNGAMLVCG